MWIEEDERKVNAVSEVKEAMAGNGVKRRCGRLYRK
jgi:hypothetical protein